MDMHNTIFWYEGLQRSINFFCWTFLFEFALSTCLIPSLRLLFFLYQLDIRAKLCIRDSLYRLARSAEQRHNCPTPNITSKNEGGQDGDIILDDSHK